MSSPKEEYCAAGWFDGLSWLNATTRKSWRMRKAYPRSETAQRSRRRRTIRRTKPTTRNTWTVARATGGPKTGSRACTVPCILWTETRLPGMLGNKRRISPHGGLQSKTARMAILMGIRRNGNFRTGTIRTSAGVSNNAGRPSTSSHRGSWRCHSATTTSLQDKART